MIKVQIDQTIVKIKDNTNGEVFEADFPSLKKAEIWIDNENRFFQKKYEIIEVIT